MVASVAAPGSPVSVGIPPGTFGTFNVTLTPRNAQGVGPPSSAAIFTIGGGCSAPPAPTGLTGRVVTGVATVQWTPSPGAYDLVCVLYLQLPPLERRIVLARAAAAVRPGGTLLVLGHDRLNLTEGWAGPTQAEVLFTPDDVVAEISDLEVVKAERVRRAMADAPPGRDAIDALVRARRPASG